MPHLLFWKLHMSNKLRLALVGAGHMGKFHAQAILDSSEAELVAVCDVDAARAAALAGPAGARVVTDPALLAGLVDAAVIAAATSAHRAVAIPLMERGIAVLIEKPLAATAAEARQIVGAAARTGAVVQVGHILRFDPVTRAIAGRIATGAAAAPGAVRPAYLEVSWVAPFTGRSMDVGVVMDVMIHGLDLVLALAGEMPSRIDAVGGVVVGPHEDFVNVRLQFPGGCVANLSASRMSRSRQRLVRIFAPGVYVKLDYQAKSVESVAIRPGVAEGLRSGKLTVGAGGMDELVAVEKLPVEATPDALRAQLASFLGAVRGEHPPVVSAEDGARAVEVAQTIIETVAKAVANR
jgi:predicted dehydrogenase